MLITRPIGQPWRNHEIPAKCQRCGKVIKGKRSKSKTRSTTCNKCKRK